jgi:hypothetical protein
VPTEKQMAANRANAQRSTGPKTAAGKARCRGNALRHGLSLRVELDPDTRRKVDAFAFAIAGENASEEQLLAATALAEAQVELQRIRKVRSGMTANLGSALRDDRVLRRLLALDGYERTALTRRRRAISQL